MNWLLLILSLPTENATARMRCWRALKACGAVVLRDGVYLLPDQGSNAESFCRDSTVGNSEFDACMKDQSSSSDQMSAIQDGIGEVKSELQHQIRSSSIDQMIRGLLLVGAGLLLFRSHGKRTELFADGLLPVQPAAAPPAAPQTK